MSLYNKYRPNSLTQIKGNSEILLSLEGMLSDLTSCPHSFLLHGPSGCGKTTIGRIIATRLGSKGNDFREVDSADFRGIDTVREIRKGAQYAAMEGANRVWLIDECHKMTNDAQNALLKILEDPPSHVYFILCTTDTQKLLATIKGRCIQFQVSPLTDIQMFGLLKNVVRQEGETLEKEVFDQIIKDSIGSARNALQILEQCLNVPSEQRLDIAKRAAAVQAESINLCRALIKGEKWANIKVILEGIKEQEPEDIRRLVLAYAQAILLKSENDRAAAIIEAFWEPTYNIGFPGVVYACYSITKT
jgi:DNA polymerase-3 subunit gamma/tau